MSESIRNLKIHNTCRICLFTTDNVEQFVFLNEDSVWLERFEFCFGIKLTAQDQQQVLCLMCSIDIKKFICFKEKCLQSHRLWETLLSDVRCNIVKIDHNINNTKENKVDTITKEIKSENLNASSEIDQNFSPDQNIDDFIEIKIEQICEQTDDNVEKDTENSKSLSKLKDNSKSNESGKKEGKTFYSCKKCNKKYVLQHTYLKHKNICQVKRSMKNQRKLWGTPDFAYNCGKKYDNEDKINKIQNNINTNQNNSPFSCGVCSHSFDGVQDLMKHLDEHWAKNDLACQLCDFVGVDSAAIAAHRYYHLPREGDVHYFCHICKHQMVSLMSLHFHYRKMHLGKAGGYCAQCDKEFTDLRLWKRHERKKHSDLKYICDICGKRYSFKYSIKDHMINSHLGIKQHICDICGNCFKTKKYLKLHINVVHTQTEPLKCTHCDRMFKSYHTLNMHLKKISVEKNYKCEVCHKAFFNGKDLASHMVMHSNVRPFGCDICGASYKYKSYAKLHMLRHSGFLPHKCSQCTKAFATSSQLKVHSSVHTGVRRHACIAQNCVRTFHSKKLMLAHLQSRHKNENFEQK